MIVIDPLKVSVKSKLEQTVLCCWLHSDDQYIILYLLTANNTAAKQIGLKMKRNFLTIGQNSLNCWLTRRFVAQKQNAELIM
jgi:hypothetical protein